MTREEYNQVHGEVITLRDYIDARLDAIEDATRIQSDAIEKRFCREVELKHDILARDINALQRYVSKAEGAASQSTVDRNFIITLIALLLSIAGLIMKFM